MWVVGLMRSVRMHAPFFVVLCALKMRVRVVNQHLGWFPYGCFLGGFLCCACVVDMSFVDVVFGAPQAVARSVSVLYVS